MTVPVLAPSAQAAAATGELKSAALLHLNSTNNTTFTADDLNATQAAAPEQVNQHLHDNEAGFSNDAFLDTTNDTQEAGSFEGPEKLLEIWFGPAPYLLQGIRNVPEQYVKEIAEEDILGGSDRYGLRIVPKPVWDEMLAIVKCKVLNTIQNDCMDAYLLSESSFFVYPHKLILKTCGTTTLLMALPKILEIAQNYCSLEKVWRVFYSRKTFMFPERQLHVHRDWKDEVAFLDRHFEHGAAYTVGKVNGDHWCLYLTAPQDDCLSHITSRRNSVSSDVTEDVVEAMKGCDVAQDETKTQDNDQENVVVVGGHETPSAPLNIVTRQCLSGKDASTSPISPVMSSSASSCSTSSSSSSVASSSSSISIASSSSSASYLYPSHDQTVEILMTNLNPEAMKRFYQRPDDVPGTVGGVRVDQDTGLAGLFPQAQLDSYLFTPCGYSANALQDGNYYTIHVTPEPVCSYASFETNIPVGLRSKSRGSKNNRSGSASASEDGEASSEEKKTDAVSTSTYTGPETLTELIAKVVEIFQPGTMSVTLFSSHLTEDGQMETERQMERRQRRMIKAMGRVAGFTRTDRILYEFEGCDLVFGHFERRSN
ncbi:spermidine resistance protein [Podila epigama]|nr:spermidine resistance protein [Podila epigama]